MTLKKSHENSSTIFYKATSTPHLGLIDGGSDKPKFGSVKELLMSSTFIQARLGECNDK